VDEDDYENELKPSIIFFELIQYTENSCFSSSKPIHTFTKSFDRLKDYNSDIGNEK